MRLVATLLTIAIGCGASTRPAAAWHLTPPPRRTPADVFNQSESPVDEGPMAALAAARESASPGAQRVLDVTRDMLENETVVRGSCFTWVNAVFRRAGGRARAVFRASRAEPHAAPERLRAGDWVFFVNHAYGDVTHSAIFVGWIDRRARTALMVSYPGERRDAPGRFGEYELSGVYNLLRLDDALPTARRPHRSQRSFEPVQTGRGDTEIVDE